MAEGRRGAEVASQQRKDFELIAGRNVFDVDLYLGVNARRMTQSAALIHYIVQTSLLDVRREPVSGLLCNEGN